MIHNITSAVILLALGSGIAAAQPPTAAPQENAGGSLQLVITYRCPPPRRAAFRQFMTQGGIQRFERWKMDGMLKDYRVLFNWFSDVDTWDAIAVLTFPSYVQIARWKEIERINPGGLPRDALDIAWPVNTYFTDLAWHGAAEGAYDRAHGVYLVIPYDYTGLAEYKDYASGYLIPQVKAWMREGILGGYDLYLNRFPAGKPWDALLILEYKDMDAFSRRDEVDAKVKAQLRSDPAWRAISESKQKAGTERESVVADTLILP